MSKKVQLQRPWQYLFGYQFEKIGRPGEIILNISITNENSCYYKETKWRSCKMFFHKRMQKIKTKEIHELSRLLLNDKWWWTIWMLSKRCVRSTTNFRLIFMKAVHTEVFIQLFC